MMNKHEDTIISLYQKTRTLEPSAALDAKVLATAQLKLNTPKNTSKRVIWALSSVAVLVLSVNVALKLVLEPQQTFVPPPAAELSKEPTLATMNDDVSMPSSIAAERTKPQQNSNAMFKYQGNEKSRKIMAKQRGLTPKVMSIPMAENRMLERGIMTPLTVINLPTLPFSQAQLLRLYPQLSVKQSDKNTLLAYVKDTLVLRLKRDADRALQITAYPQSSTLGIMINWGLLPSHLDNCSDRKGMTHCAINPVVTGYFKNNRLIKVSWIQKPL